jgi:sphingosine kinase
MLVNTSLPFWKGKQFWIVVNPYSGGKLGRVVWETILFPKLEESGVSYSLLLTEYAGHAAEVARTAKFVEAIDVIVIVSGDGLLHEVLNGLAERFPTHQLFMKFLKTVSFALIPAGTSNGLSSSLVSSDPKVAVSKLFTDSPKNVDLIQIWQESSSRPKYVKNGFCFFLSSSFFFFFFPSRKHTQHVSSTNNRTFMLFHGGFLLMQTL